MLVAFSIACFFPRFTGRCIILSVRGFSSLNFSKIFDVLSVLPSLTTIISLFLYDEFMQDLTQYSIFSSSFLTGIIIEISGSVSRDLFLISSKGSLNFK